MASFHSTENVQECPPEVVYAGLSMETVPGGSVDFLGMLSLERLDSVEFLDWLLVWGWQCWSVSE